MLCKLPDLQDMPHVLNNESELLHMLASGDQHAYKVIFEHYWDPVYSTALLLTKSPDLAEDIAQDIFTMVWEKRSGMAAVGKFEGFLFVAARNMIYTRLRKLASGDAYRQHILNCFREQDETWANGRAEFKELESTILEAIQQLPPQQQKAFKLSRFEGMRHEDIAITMGVSRITIKSYIVQAIATLRKTLANHPSGALITYWIFFFLEAWD